MEHSNSLFKKSNLKELNDSDTSNYAVIKNNYSSNDITLSLLLPTRQRVDHLDRFLKSLIENTSCLKTIEIIIYVDNDDIASQKYENKGLNITKVIGPRLTMGQYNTVCYSYSAGNIVMLANDDVVIETRDWDSLLKTELSKVSDEVYLAYPNDGFNKKNLCTFPILSRKTCEALVYPFPPLYKRLFIDTHVMDVFIRLNRCIKQRVIYLEDIKFTHLKLNSHINESNAIQRINHDDDVSFVLLRNLRESQSRRLKSIVNSEKPVEIVHDFENVNRDMNYFCFLKWFLLEFFYDNGLPVYARVKYLIRFSGHFFMIRTSLGLFLARSISILKKETKFSY